MPGKWFGELVVRTSNLDEMDQFYRETIGLEPYLTTDTMRFFTIAEGLPGHPQVLAIFGESRPSNGPGQSPFSEPDVVSSSLHHFAFMMEREAFEGERKRLSALGIELRYAEHFPMKWRSVYFFDPDGNTVEFVCHDESIEPAGT